MFLVQLEFDKRNDKRSKQPKESYPKDHSLCNTASPTTSLSRIPQLKQEHNTQTDHHIDKCFVSDPAPEELFDRKPQKSGC